MIANDRPSPLVLDSLLVHVVISRQRYTFTFPTSFLAKKTRSPSRPIDHSREKRDVYRSFEIYSTPSFRKYNKNINSRIFQKCANPEQRDPDFDVSPRRVRNRGSEFFPLPDARNDIFIRKRTSARGWDDGIRALL